MRALTIAALALLSLPYAAHADTVTDLIKFHGSELDGNVVDMSFTLTYDPAITDTLNWYSFGTSTTGVSLLSASTTDTAYEHSFDVQQLGWMYTSGELFIGGVGPQNVVYGIQEGTNDFTLVINNARTDDPTLREYDASSLSRIGYVNGRSPFQEITTGSVTITPEVTGSAVTPEPSSFLLLGTGMLGVVGTLRKRFA